jgi:hypothetical protein
MNGDFSSKKRTPEGVIWLLMIWKVLFCENVAGLKRRAQEEAILPSLRKLTQIRAREQKKKKRKQFACATLDFAYAKNEQQMGLGICGFRAR